MTYIIVHPNPPVSEGKLYDRLSVSLAMSTETAEGGTLLRLAVTLTPFRLAEDGRAITLLERQQAFAYANALDAAAYNQPLAIFLGDLVRAGQEFINEVLK